MDIDPSSIGWIISFNSCLQLSTIILDSRFVCSSNSSAAVWPVRSLNSKSEPLSIPSNTTWGTTFAILLELVSALNPSDAIKALNTSPFLPPSIFLFLPLSI